MSREVLSTAQLYRSFLKAVHRWPSQPLREIDMSVALRQQIRAQFRRLDTQESSSSNKYTTEQAYAQLLALQRLVDNASYKEHQGDTSQLTAYLPPKKMYQLLDKEVQADINSGQIRPSLFANLFRKASQ